MAHPTEITLETGGVVRDEDAAQKVRVRVTWALERGDGDLAALAAAWRQTSNGRTPPSGAGSGAACPPRRRRSPGWS